MESINTKAKVQTEQEQQTLDPEPRITESLSEKNQEENKSETKASIDKSLTDIMPSGKQEKALNVEKEPEEEKKLADEEPDTKISLKGSSSRDKKSKNARDEKLCSDSTGKVGSISEQKAENKIDEKQDGENSENDGSSFEQGDKVRDDGNYYLPHYVEKHWEAVQNSLESLSKGYVNLDKVPKIIGTFLTDIIELEQVHMKGFKEFLLSYEPTQKTQLEKVTFPFMAKLVLDTPKIFPKTYFPLLWDEYLEPLALKKKQVACLLAHMFFCTNLKHPVKTLPRDCNLLQWYDLSRHDPVNEAKIKCVLNYFTRLAVDGIPDQFIIFKRLGFDLGTHGKCSHKNWLELESDFKEVDIRYDGSIFDAKGSIEIDFANKFLGGGVLRHGAVQEEIMMTIAPESLVGLLFNKVMDDNEAILIQGTQQYCDYEGYGNTFKFKGDYKDTREASEVNPGVFNREIIAIDAVPFGKDPDRQYDSGLIIREINKAYLGFSSWKDLTTTRKAIATGRWGCGVFKGDPQLKFLLQWIAASRADRKLEFYCFGNQGLDGIEKVVGKMKGWSLGKAVKAAIDFGTKKGKKKGFFEFLLSL